MHTFSTTPNHIKLLHVAVSRSWRLEEYNVVGLCRGDFLVTVRAHATFRVDLERCSTLAAAEVVHVLVHATGAPRGCVVVLSLTLALESKAPNEV